MSSIARLFGIGVVIAISDMLLAQAGRKDIAYAITLAGVCIALAIIIPELNKVFKATLNIFGF